MWSDFDIETFYLRIQTHDLRAVCAIATVLECFMLHHYCMSNYKSDKRCKTTAAEEQTTTWSESSESEEISKKRLFNPNISGYPKRRRCQNLSPLSLASNSRRTPAVMFHIWTWEGNRSRNSLAIEQVYSFSESTAGGDRMQDLNYRSRRSERNRRDSQAAGWTQQDYLMDEWRD